jgi:hypothetical protein
MSASSGPGSTSAQPQSGCAVTAQAALKQLSLSTPPSAGRQLLASRMTDTDPQSVPMAHSLSTVRRRRLSAGGGGGGEGEEGGDGPVSGNNEVGQNRDL